jgi:hypothetical protein
MQVQLLSDVLDLLIGLLLELACLSFELLELWAVD